MDVESPQPTRTVDEWTFYFRDNKTFMLDLPEGGSIEETGDLLVFAFAGRTIRVHRAQLLYTEHRVRVDTILDPKNNPVAQMLETLESRRKRVAAQEPDDE